MDAEALDMRMSFGKCLRSILQEKGISASEAARCMGMKSRNGIFRMLSGEGSDAGKSAFVERFCQCMGDRIDARDRERLEGALELERVGEEGVRQNRAMRMLLSGEIAPEPPMRLYRQARYPEDLAGMLKSYVTGRSLSITMLGCCSRAIFEQLAQALASADAQCEISIEHYICSGREEITGNLYAIRPLLGDPRYKVFCIEPGRLSPQKEQICRNNIAGITACDADGRERFHYMMQVDPGVLHLIECRDGASHRRMRRLLADERENMRLLTGMFELPRTARDCLIYLEARFALEHGRELYLMRRSMPASIVHPNLLVYVFRDAFEHAGVARAEADEILTKIGALQQKRRENALFKKKPTHAIVTRPGLEDLTRTGGHADLRYPVKAYAPAQRVELLTQLREQATANPYFHLHIFKEGFEPNGLEINLYGGEGALLSRPQTVCDELMITHPAFLDRYRDYLSSDLLARQVITEREGVQLLDALIAEAEALA